jgi:predicted transcriptional regulator
MAHRRKVSLGSTRTSHERSVHDHIQRANVERKRANQSATCPAALGHLFEATRANAQARSHLVSIGPKDSKRTRQLWGVVGRQGKDIERALKSMEASGCINKHPGGDTERSLFQALRGR